MKRIRFPDGSEAVILFEDEKTGAKILDRRPDKNQMMWISIGKYEVLDELTMDEIERRIKEKEIGSSKNSEKKE